MIDILRYIDINFSGVLSVIVSSITALITLIYVVFTYKQLKASQDATKTAIQQLRLNNQPCLTIEVSSTDGTECFSGTRRQLHINMDLENVGDSPALSVYVFGHLELQYTKHVKNGSNIVEMDYIPDFQKCIKAGQKVTSSIRFETFEINMLVEDLRINYQKNMKRLLDNPTHSPYRGTILVLETYYRNLLGQWFRNTVRQEIPWINDLNAKPRKTHNINENTIPPCTLKPDTRFQLQLISPHLSVFSTELIESAEIEERLQKFDRYLKY